jgi:hypothetical protein
MAASGNKVVINFILMNLMCLMKLQNGGKGEEVGTISYRRGCVMTPQPRISSDPKNLIQFRSDESECEKTKGELEGEKRIG